MRCMFRQIHDRLKAGESLVLVTITAASGATPRGAGARMLVGSEGRICGTIGGGAVEYRSEQLAKQVLKSGISQDQDFSLNREDVQNLGMICGGEVHVYFHYIPAGDETVIALAREAERIFETGAALWMLMHIGSGRLSLYTKDGGIRGESVPGGLAERLTRRPQVVELENEAYLVEQINSPGRVYIFGCGHVSRELQPVLTHLGFRCVMLDDRSEFARRELFPTAEDVRVVDFSRIADFVSIGSEDYVCIMTRGHAYDTVIQAQVLRCTPCYVGVIGSRKKAAAVRMVLKRDYGMSDQELDRITTPIGLEIEAETPAEIAISIAAQMIQVRARINMEPHQKDCPSAGCVIMASGMGRRFGGNKLMADFGGEKMICRALKATEGLFERRVVVTRHEDVAALCRERGIEVLLHDLPSRSDAVRLGLEALGNVDGCMFCPGDQPLLRRETVAALVQSWRGEREAIWRTAFGDTPGSPVLFPAWAFNGLLNLPEGKGGAHVISSHPDRVRCMQVADKYELMDADTPEALDILRACIAK